MLEHAVADPSQRMLRSSLLIGQHSTFVEIEEAAAAVPVMIFSGLIRNLLTAFFSPRVLGELNAQD